MYKTFMLKFKHKKKTWQPWILEDPLPCLTQVREREREREKCGQET